MANKSQHNINYNKYDEYKSNRELDISPPNSASEPTSLLPESKSISLHISSFIHQQFQPIPSLQNLVNVLYHHILHLRHFTFETIDPISIRITREILHLLTQNPRKFIVHPIRLSRENRATVSPDESLVNFLEKRKRDSPAGVIVGHAENGEAIGAFEVEDEAILRVRDVGIVVSGNFVEDLLGDCAGVCGGSAEFS